MFSVGKIGSSTKRLAAGVAGDVLFLRRHQHDVAGLDGELAALRERRAGALEHVDAFLVAVMAVRPAQWLALLRHRDFDDPEGDARADLARHHLEGAARPGSPSRLPLLLRDPPRHRVTLFRFAAFRHALHRGEYLVLPSHRHSPYWPNGMRRPRPLHPLRVVRPCTDREAGRYRSLHFAWLFAMRLTKHPAEPVHRANGMRPLSSPSCWSSPPARATWPRPRR